MRPPDPTARVGQFSGGNQQKVVLAKWMDHQPTVLVLDEPTQGIDAGAKFDVLQTICDAAAAGAVVLIASGDYEQWRTSVTACWFCASAQWSPNSRVLS